MISYIKRINYLTRQRLVSQKRAHDFFCLKRTYKLTNLMSLNLRYSDLSKSHFDTSDSKKISKKKLTDSRKTFTNKRNIFQNMINCFPLMNSGFFTCRNCKLRSINKCL